MNKLPDKALLDASTIDEIHAIFEQLVAFMGDRWTSANVYASRDGASTQCGMTCSDAASQFSYSERINGPRVAVTPQGVSLGPGATQQFTAAVSNPDGSAIEGAAVTWSVSAGSSGAVDATGLYTAPGAIPAAATDTVVATHESGSSASVAVSLHP